MPNGMTCAEHKDQPGWKYNGTGPLSAAQWKAEQQHLHAFSLFRLALVSFCSQTTI